MKTVRNLEPIVIPSEKLPKLYLNKEVLNTNSSKRKSLPNIRISNLTTKNLNSTRRFKYTLRNKVSPRLRNLLERKQINQHSENKIKNNSSKKEEEDEIQGFPQSPVIQSIRNLQTLAIQQFNAKNKNGTIESIQGILLKAAEANEFRILLKAYTLLGEIAIHFKEPQLALESLLYAVNLFRIKYLIHLKI